MMHMAEAHGTPVLSRGDAEQLGTVRRLLVDVDARRITAVHIDGRRRKALLVDWEALAGFGPDAVVVGSGDALRGPDGGYELTLVAGDLDWIGRRVLNDRGDSAGKVRDVDFDETTGALRSILTDRGSHPAADLVALGPYCVIVRA